MYVVTGATGQLGRLVVEQLLAQVPPGEVVAAVRTPDRAGDLAARGVTVREADYDHPDTVRSALAGARRVLLISGDAVGRRLPQHRAVIEAAAREQVELFAYTSILHADRSPLRLAHEHRETEEAIAEAGLPAVLLRNGWYTENWLAGLPATLASGAIVGASREGRFSLAARADYAAAAATLLVEDGHAGCAYELGGDEGWSRAAFAAELSRQAGRLVAYRNLEERADADEMAAAGLPPAMAEIVADADARGADDELFEPSGTLAKLIGRSTTPVETSIRDALAAA